MVLWWMEVRQEKKSRNQVTWRISCSVPRALCICSTHRADRTNSKHHHRSGRTVLSNNGCQYSVQTFTMWSLAVLGHQRGPFFFVLFVRYSYSAAIIIRVPFLLLATPLFCGPAAWFSTTVHLDCTPTCILHIIASYVQHYKSTNLITLLVIGLQFGSNH
jgi:hypothetical protein